MAEETSNQGRLDAQAYKADPVNVESPTSSHHSYEKGVRAELLIIQQSVLDEVTDTITPVLPSSDQKAAMDAANSPSSSNPFATTSDVAVQAAASQAAYYSNAAAGVPADGEVSMDNADPALATVVRVANISSNGLNDSNQTLLLGDSDVIMIADVIDATKVYNFDVTGDPTQVGGAGTGGYVEVPVTLFSQGGGGTIADGEVANVLMRYDGSNTKFLAKANNLSDLQNAATARTNLDVYAKASVYTQSAADGLFLKQSTNLSDLDNAATARSNLGVYSTTEGDSRYLISSSNLSDLTNIGDAKVNIGLGSVLNVEQIPASWLQTPLNPVSEFRVPSSKAVADYVSDEISAGSGLPLGIGQVTTNPSFTNESVVISHADITPTGKYLIQSEMFYSGGTVVGAGSVLLMYDNGSFVGHYANQRMQLSPFYNNGGLLGATGTVNVATMYVAVPGDAAWTVTVTYTLTTTGQLTVSLTQSANMTPTVLNEHGSRVSTVISRA
jgi:hypothetical protein